MNMFNFKIHLNSVGWGDETSRNDVSPYEFSGTPKGRPSPKINRPGTHNVPGMIHHCHYMHDTKQICDARCLWCIKAGTLCFFLGRFILGSRDPRKFVRGHIVSGCPINPPSVVSSYAGTSRWRDHKSLNELFPYSSEVTCTVPHGCGVNIQDIDPSLLLGQSDLHLHLQTTRSQQGVIDHIFSVRHPLES